MEKSNHYLKSEITEAQQNLSEPIDSVEILKETHELVDITTNGNHMFYIKTKDG